MAPDLAGLRFETAEPLRLRWSPPIILLGVWIVLLALAQWVRPAHFEESLCMFRNVTGTPCPTCGTTRAVMAALDGRVVDAIVLNPLVAAAAVAAGAWLLLRVLGRRLAVDLTPRHRAALWTLAGVLAAANWIWVIARETMRSS